MEIVVSNVSKEEMRILMKPLVIEYLRAPVLEDNKLAKKYITGFRANNVTYFQLVPLYYNEIRNGNIKVEKALRSALVSYIKECNLVDLIDSIPDEMTWEESVQFGIRLGESGCEIGLELLLKISSKSIPDEKKDLLIRLQEYGLKKAAVQEELVANYEEKVNELANLNEKQKKEIVLINEKKDQVVFQKKELITQISHMKAEKEKAECKIGVLDIELTETKQDLNKKVKELEQMEKSLLLLNELLKEKEDTISKQQTTINDIEGKNKILEDQKIVKYDETIIRLVVDTIEDLREKYDVDIKDFERILAGINGEQNIANVWHYISTINEQFIEEIEAELRENKIKMEIIDKCNEVENLILSKYVMIKAIKSLHYEYMSCLEKNEMMFEELRK